MQSGWMQNGKIQRGTRAKKLLFENEEVMQAKFHLIRMRPWSLILQQMDAHIRADVLRAFGNTFLSMYCLNYGQNVSERR